MSLESIDILYLAGVIGLGYVGTIVLWLFIGPRIAKKALFDGLEAAISGKDKTANRALQSLESYFTNRAIKRVENHLKKALDDQNSKEFKLMFNMTSQAFSMLDALIVEILKEGQEVPDPNNPGQTIKTLKLPKSFLELFKVLRINMMQSFSQSLAKGINKVKSDMGDSAIPLDALSGLMGSQDGKSPLGGLGQIFQLFQSFGKGKDGTM